MNRLSIITLIFLQVTTCLHAVNMQPHHSSETILALQKKCRELSQQLSYANFRLSQVEIKSETCFNNILPDIQIFKKTLKLPCKTSDKEQLLIEKLQKKIGRYEEFVQKFHDAIQKKKNARTAQ